MAASFNTSGLNSALTLSGSNLVVEHTGADADANVRLGIGSATGKSYVELTVNVFTSSDFNSLQFGLSTSGVGNNVLLWADSNAVGTSTAGNGWFVNFSATGTTTSYVATDRVDFAIDWGAGKIWMRVNNGSWQGSASGGDPAAGTSGYSFAPGGTLEFRVSLFKLNQKVTAVTAAGSWAGSAPSGFGELPEPAVDMPESVDEEVEDGNLANWFDATRLWTFDTYFGHDAQFREADFYSSTTTMPLQGLTDETWQDTVQQWFATVSPSAIAIYQQGLDSSPQADDATADVTGTLAATEGSDTAAITGLLAYSGSLAATEGSDTAAFTGTVGADVTGTLAATEGRDAAQITGTTPVTDSAGGGGARLRRAGIELAQALADRHRRKAEETEPAPEPPPARVAPEVADRPLSPVLLPPPAAVSFASPVAGGPNPWTMARTAQMRRALDERRRLALEAEDDDIACILLLAS